MTKKTTPKKLIRRVADYIDTNSLIQPGDNILVGLSGGPDSVAMLDILNTLKHELGITLAVGHFNHDLRRGAKADEAFSAKLAESYHLPYFSQTWSTRASKQASVSEGKAREARFKFFARTVNQKKLTAVALAHTQNDVAETYLMRMIRGSGLAGMQSILPKRKIDGLTVIRPLLDVSKDDLLAYNAARKLKYRIDPTNAQNVYTRNRVRNELIPQLQKFNPQIIALLARSSVNIASDYALLERLADKTFTELSTKTSRKGEVKLDLSGFSAQPDALKHMLIRRAFEQVNGNLNALTADHIAEVRDLAANRPAGSVVDLPKGLHAKKTRQKIIFST